MKEELEKLQAQFKGYHISLSLFPSGGMIDAEGCKQCGTEDHVFESTRWKEKKDQSIDDAVARLKIKLGI